MKLKHILGLLTLFTLAVVLAACGGNTPAVKQKLTVAFAGTGSGTVMSAPTGIDCDEDCSADFNKDAAVTLTATADEGSSFVSWSGSGCTGTGNCVVTMNQAKTVTATFNTDGGNNGDTTHTLTVAKDTASTGTGTITSDPPGIDCGEDCTEDFDAGTTVTLTATADASGTVTFAGCTPVTGDDTQCTVDMNADTTVTVTFNAAGVNSYNLSVVTDGTGSGTVTSGDTKINCGTLGTGNTTCSATYTEADPAMTVTLTATPTDGDSVFAGFTGCTPDDSATPNVCTVTMEMAQSVTATFNNNTGDPVLTVNKLGNGAGDYRVLVNGLEYFSPKSYENGTELTISARLRQGGTAEFLGWGGACSAFTSTQDCELILGEDTTVTAVFSDGTEPRATSSITSGEDDAEEYLNGFTQGSTFDRGFVQLNSSELDLAFDPGRAGTLTGLRFAGLDNDVSGLPANAEIIYAYIEFKASEASPSEPGSPVELLIRGEDQDIAGSFVAFENNLELRPKTEASITWKPPVWTSGSGDTKRTANLASIIEEIASRPTWDGKAMAFFVSPPLNPAYDDGQPISDSNQKYDINELDYRTAWSADSNNSLAVAPQLVIIYETPAAP